jgi:hypothetical protein
LVVDKKGRKSVDNIRRRRRAESVPRYTLNELLMNCKPNAVRTKGERQWLTGRPVGRELI